MQLSHTVVIHHWWLNNTLFNLIYLSLSLCLCFDRDTIWQFFNDIREDSIFVIFDWKKKSAYSFKINESRFYWTNIIQGWGQVQDSKRKTPSWSQNSGNGVNMPDVCFPAYRRCIPLFFLKYTLKIFPPTWGIPSYTWV